MARRRRSSSSNSSGSSNNNHSNHSNHGSKKSKNNGNVSVTARVWVVLFLVPFLPVGEGSVGEAFLPVTQPLPPPLCLHQAQALATPPRRPPRLPRPHSSRHTYRHRVHRMAHPLRPQQPPRPLRKKKCSLRRRLCRRAFVQTLCCEKLPRRPGLCLGTYKLCIFRGGGAGGGAAVLLVVLVVLMCLSASVAALRLQRVGATSSACSSVSTAHLRHPLPQAGCKELRRHARVTAHPHR